jgi:hypothetical protein
MPRLRNLKGKHDAGIVILTNLRHYLRNNENKTGVFATG